MHQLTAQNFITTRITMVMRRVALQTGRPKKGTTWVGLLVCALNRMETPLFPPIILHGSAHACTSLQLTMLAMRVSMLERALHAISSDHCLRAQVQFLTYNLNSIMCNQLLFGGNTLFLDFTYSCSTCVCVQQNGHRSREPKRRPENKKKVKQQNVHPRIIGLYERSMLNVHILPQTSAGITDLKFTPN